MSSSTEAMSATATPSAGRQRRDAFAPKLEHAYLQLFEPSKDHTVVAGPVGDRQTGTDQLRTVDGHWRRSDAPARTSYRGRTGRVMGT